MVSLDLARFARHAFFPAARVHVLFPRRTMHVITQAVRDAEHLHGGEIRVAIEGALDWPELLRGVTPRQRAVELFSLLRVWDTEHNDGVLIYLLLAEHAVEIVCDRGLTSKVPPEQWQSVCRVMEEQLSAGRHLEAVLLGVAALSTLLAEHAPNLGGAKRNELPDAPVVVKR
ncbi:MAG: TPM domain-containing protein [Betaproteobacteria bacterium]|jgi:hypothetical protein|nr:TPM domain-containing protein [Betaproteobacteria bacterium]